MPDKMDTETALQPNIAPAASSPRNGWRRILFKVVAPVLILGVGITAAANIRQTSPKVHRRPPAATAPMVQVEAATRSQEQVLVKVMGSVVPARQIVLKSRVSGEVIAMAPEFVDGGLFKTDEEIMKLDEEDYQLDVVQKQSAVTEANYNLKLEQGHQEVAKREWEILNGQKPSKSLDAELALRKPHLAKARSDLWAAQANLKQSRLNLERTTICAPFNAIVRTRYVDLGSQVTAQGDLAELVGTDRYWIKVSVPVGYLKWITIPNRNGEPGSPAQVTYRNEYQRPGRVVKLLGDLESEGRMARLLVAVDDPLDLKIQDARRPPLLIGEYVRVEIQGQALENVFRIPRSVLRENGEIWVVDQDDRLTIREVETIWRDTDFVILKNGLKAGERLIVSDMSEPVEGMQVRIAGLGGRISERTGSNSDEPKNNRADANHAN